MACKVKEELLEKEVRARAGNGNAAGCVNGVLDYGVKVFQATNRRDRTRGLVPVNHPGCPGKQKER